jgi:hypothetical protein
MREPHRLTRRFAATDYPGDVTAADERVYHTSLLGTPSERVMVGDGAVGTRCRGAGVTETKYVRLHSG